MPTTSTLPLACGRCDPNKENACEDFIHAEMRAVTSLLVAGGFLFIYEEAGDTFPGQLWR